MPIRFLPMVPYPVESTPNSIVAADFNGDDIMDLAVTNTNASTMGILINSTPVAIRGIRLFS